MEGLSTLSVFSFFSITYIDSFKEVLSSFLETILTNNELSLLI